MKEPLVVLKHFKVLLEDVSKIFDDLFSVIVL